MLWIMGNVTDEFQIGVERAIILCVICLTLTFAPAQPFLVLREGGMPDRNYLSQAYG